MIVSVDDAELFYSSRGVGPVCLVPSAVGTKAYERQMPPQLSEAVMWPALLGHLMGALTKDWDISRDPGSLRVPLLLAHGRCDYTVPYTLWDGIEAVLPTATRHLFQRSGHQPFFEEPDEFATVVTAWMR
jgi:pimeloyl-ACP methyl ester carboxylesterase